MRKSLLIFISFIITALIAAGCGDQETNDEGKVMMLKERIAQYAPVEVTYDSTLLDDRQKMVVDKLYQAALVMDELFLEQVYYKNSEIREELQKIDTEEGKLLREFFTINFGPFDRLDNNKPFYGTEEKPPGANYYPVDMTKEEFNNWIKENPDDEEAFTDEFTIIRREGEKLVAIPYSEAYKEKLEKAAALLKEAAEYADNPSLKKYLELRADAFLSNDYFDSDMAWMDLNDYTIEVVIGPYEVYEDELFNYKAAFECFLTLVDPEETKKLEVIASYLDAIEKNLPLADKYKTYERGGESPIVVVQEVFSAGDTKAGVQTLAFNLPNDERVRQAKGSKKVMLKNIHEAKFEKLLKPISQIVLAEELHQYVTFAAFFNHTLMHEMSHGVGPGIIMIDGKKTSVQKELKETYSKLEECKADILGMYNNMLMIEKGEYAQEFEKELWTTFLAGVFRSVRFGINSAHGSGDAIIFNYLLKNGAYEFDSGNQVLLVNFDKIYDVVKELAGVVLLIQAQGDYEGAKALIDQYGVVSDEMSVLIDKLNELPVDIKPEFQISK